MTSASLILASGSAARRKLLEEAGLAFTVISSPFDEDAAKAEEAFRSMPLPQRALMLARGKAKAVSRLHPDALVIGGDQICELEGEALSKPGTHDKAAHQLMQLQGRTHFQHSAVCLYQDGLCLWEHVATAELTMRPLNEVEINAYLHRDTPYGSAGSYRFEAGGAALFSPVKGNRETIMGLPLTPLLDALEQYTIPSPAHSC